MKLVTAVIKPHKWEDVREALETFGVTRTKPRSDPSHPSGLAVPLSRAALGHSPAAVRRRSHRGPA